MEESLQRVKEVTEGAIQNGLKVRGYISMVIADPDEGPTDPKITANIAEKLLNFGCYEVSLGDTIGVGTARSVSRLLDEVLRVVPAEKLAVHFHDTYGQALANVLVAIEVCCFILLLHSLLLEGNSCCRQQRIRTRWMSICNLSSPDNISLFLGQRCYGESGKRRSSVPAWGSRIWNSMIPRLIVHIPLI